MPGRLFIDAESAALADLFGCALQGTGPDLPDPDIAPGTDLWVLDDARTLRPMRWGMILSGQSKGRRRPLMETVVNARSESVFSKPAFEGARRGIVAAHGWYEWTGPPRRKKRWRFAAADNSLMAFAAIYSVWQAPGGGALHQCATLTCEPNDLVRPIHHRMGVILPPEAWDPWLDGAAVPLEPAPPEALKLEDWPER